jgi:hypothetical protein
MKQLSDYYDKWMLISTLQSNGARDGGDTCANEFTVAYCNMIAPTEPIKGIRLSLSQLYKADEKKFVRHPDASRWYSGTNRFSRDQLRPLLYFLCAHSKSGFPLADVYKQRLFSAHAKRLFCFTWNTRRNFQYANKTEHEVKSTPDVKWNYGWKLPDITGPEVWATWLRSLRWPILWPVLVLLDLELLLNACIVRFSDNTDIRNHALGCHYHHTLMPTPLTWLCMQLLRRSKPSEKWTKEFNPPHQPPINRSLDKILGLQK